MQLHKAGDIRFCSAEARDLDFIREVVQNVYARYQGEGPQWQLPSSEAMWPISFGGRAGVLGIKVKGRIACVKLFYDERMRAKLRVALGHSKGRRAYQHGVRLKEIGIACPRMLGYAERRPAGPSLIVTELIEDATRIDRWVPEHGVERDALVGLAHFVRHMHDNGVSHLDLSPRNILVRRRNGTLEFLLLDYEDARFARRVSRRKRLNNLHHLHERVAGYVSLRNRLRFLRIYAQQEYPVFRDALVHTMTRSDFQWLRHHAGPNTTSIPSQGTR
jgi:tRNA A-37 threonylcarbamoyl transferase component Bud32